MNRPTPAPRIVHTLPCLLRGPHDLPMATACLASLAAAEPAARLVLCNQGYLDNRRLGDWLRQFRLDTTIVGDGSNVGIAAGRSTCFQWIWANLPTTTYVSEIHLDMLFPFAWSERLASWLAAHPDEPLVCPGILSNAAILAPEEVQLPALPQPWWEHTAAIAALLRQHERDAEIAGFVHPVLHRASELRASGAYDTRFLRGHQGYEDDSLLLAHRLRIGLKHDWRPRSWLGVRVFHQTLAQRAGLPGALGAATRNFQGLLSWYGALGLEQLARLYPQSREFSDFHQKVIDNLARPERAPTDDTPP